uniref:Uncharacterized protein n=1 Tax=Oryza nivara TaxID=4536 RepID=A0A0E0FPI4_ORYNI
MARVPVSRHLRVALLALLVVAVAAAAAARGDQPSRGHSMAARHERWMARFGRAYADAAEKARRMEVFAANAERVDAANRAGGDRTYTLGLNQFSDLTDDEFARAHLGYSWAPPPPSHRHGHRAENGTAAAAADDTDVPDSVDWRARGAVTELATGNLVSLSEQQVLDCTGGANTCSGGDVSAALRYIAASGGLQTEAAYAYGGQQGACRAGGFAAPNSAAAVGGARWARLYGDEGALQALAAGQPVVVVVEASEPDFRHYRSGVYAGSAACGRRLNHAVTVVGYGAAADGGGEYWLVKNQWGTWWGEGGYMRVARGGAAGGNCGIATYAFYPTMDS